MTLLRYGTTGSIANPWDVACKQHDDGEISTAELRALARDLFDGTTLNEVLDEINTATVVLSAMGYGHL